MDLRMLLFQTIEATKGIGRGLFSNLLWLAKNKEARGGAAHAAAHGHDEERKLDELTLDDLVNRKLGLNEIAFLLSDPHVNEKTEQHEEVLDTYVVENKLSRKKIHEGGEVEDAISKYTEHHHEKTNDRKFEHKAEYLQEFVNVLRTGSRNYRGLGFEQILNEIKRVAKEQGIKAVLGQYVEAKRAMDAQRYKDLVTYHQSTKHGFERKRELASKFIKEYEGLIPDDIKQKYESLKPETLAEEVEALLHTKANDIAQYKGRYMKKKKDEAHGAGHDGPGH